MGLGEEGHFDTEIYETRDSKFAGYVTSIGTTDEQDVSRQDAVQCFTEALY